LFSLVLHPLALKIQQEFPNLLLNVWYLDDGCIVGDMADVYAVFQLLQAEGPSRGLHLNVKKNEIWWPSRTIVDPFPAEVDLVSNEGVKLLGVPVGTKAFTTDFIGKKLKVLRDVCDLLKEVDNAQVELGLFRGCLSFNKINHLLRTCPPDLLEEALGQFDEHFHFILATIMRVPCLAEDQWEQASLPVKFAGLGVNQTKIVAGPAYIGSCVLTRDLVAALLKRKEYEPSGLTELLAVHEVATSVSHDLADLTTHRSAAAVVHGTSRGHVSEVDGEVEHSQQQSDARLLNASCQRLASCTPHRRSWSCPAIRPVSRGAQVSLGHASVQ
jgi:hypothetical protein